MEEKKVKLTVLGFSFNQTQSGTYGLVLAEDGGLRRLMIVVGAPEAQSIAFKLQNTEPPRPLTHDLFQSFMSNFGIVLQEVFIYKYENGVFYSQLIFRQNERVVSIDSRTSDAIGIALRTKSSIFTTEEIMKNLAVVFSSTDEDPDSKDFVSGNDSTEYMDTYAMLSKDELESMLKDAISHEDYELASVLKEELDKRLDH
ncbi:bifunctional nuclease family protein [Dysgonomonas sp. OttesenSCG-928-M03]|nr:bifunctional nuclease family protein [Dysgonomonas sp. OttesenSCG-928-M03]